MTALIRSIYQATVINKPMFVLLALILAGLFFASHVSNFKLDASSDSLLLEDDEDLRIFRETAERYATQDFLFVAFTPNSDLFSDESLNAIAALKKDLESLPKTDSVLSLIDVPLLKIVGGKLSEVASNYKTLADANVDRVLAKQELLESPVFNELIISKDGNTTALLVNLKNDADYLALQKQKNQLLIQKLRGELDEAGLKSLEETLVSYDQIKVKTDIENHENIENVRAILKKHAATGDLRLGGITMIADDMITFIKNDLIIFGSGIFLFLILLLSIIFKRLRWVCLPLLSCLFSGLIMLGLLGLLGWRVTVISSNFISLMLILTMSMNVHLIVRYRQLRAEMADASQSELVLATTQKMVWPCLYTALTTMIGFSSLVFSGIKPVIDFGWMMTLGLGVTFLTSFLLFPSILLFLSRSDKDKQQSDSVPMMSFLAALTERHGNKVLIISMLLAVLSVYGMSRLKVENSFINYFSDSTEIYQGLKLIDDKLGGTTPLDIILDFNEEEDIASEEDEEDYDDLDALFGDIESNPADAYFTSDKLETISAVHDYVDSLEPVGKVLSLTSILRLAQSLNAGQPFDAFELAVINKRMPVELKASMLDPYVSIDNNEARVTLRIKDSLPDLRRKELLDKIALDLQQNIGLEPEQFQITGLLVLYNNMLQSLFKSQIMTLGVVMLGIALMLLVLFRSVRLALIGIIPNILAAAIILGIMGLFNIPLDMMTITIAAITIGIAVDNAIHYIYRFREELPRHHNQYLETMKVCHANIGRAVFYTAVTIIVGFSILVLSNFIPTIYFGLLTALAMFIALLAALTLLPKLILIFKPF